MGFMETKFCELCDEDYDWAAPECPGCVHRRYSEAQAKRFADLKIERDAFEAEIERLHKRIEDIGKAHAVALQLSQPHEPVGRTEYVVDLERRIARVEGLQEWALSRVAHCAAIEEKYQKKTRYDIPIEPVEARQERRTLEAVLRIIEGKDNM